MNKFNPSQFTILMVDDNPKNLQLLGNMLRNEGYQLEFATSGPTALAWFEKKIFDLVLLDIMMPDMSGFEVCEKLRSDHKQDDIPVIFLTAKTEKESILQGFSLGAQDYVTKPFDTSELLARVRTHLELRFSKEQLKNMNQILEDKVKERTHELQEAYHKIQKANEELLILDQAKTEFLHIISHEIRTPLNGIKGSLELIKEYSPVCIGFNCIKPVTFKSFIQMQFTLNYHFGFYLNCGKGNISDNTIECGINPYDYSNIVKEYLPLSPVFVGSCCGSDSSHTKSLRELIDELYRN